MLTLMKMGVKRNNPIYNSKDVVRLKGLEVKGQIGQSFVCLGAYFTKD